MTAMTPGQYLVWLAAMRAHQLQIELDAALAEVERLKAELDDMTVERNALLETLPEDQA